MESLTVRRRKLQSLQHTLLGVAAVAIFLGQWLLVALQVATIPQAVLNGLVALALAIALVRFHFGVVYRFFSADERRLQESLILLDIATALGSTRELTRLLQLIARLTAQACQVHRCSILLWDEGQQRMLPLMSRYASGLSDRQQWERFRSTNYAQTVGEVPLLTQVLERREPLVLDEAAISSLPESWAKPFGVRALLLVPLITRDHVTGLMALDRIEPGGFDQDQINLAVTIASQASVCLENARLFKELNQNTQRLALLAETSMGVTSTLELDFALNRATAGLCAAFHVQVCGLALLDEEHLVARLVAEHPQRTVAAPRTIPLRNNPPVERIMRARQPLASEDALRDPLLASLRDIMRQRDVRSVLIVPLVVKGAVIGLIGMGATAAKRAFTTEEIELAQTVANQISVAVENARLYQQRMDDISKLKEVDELKSNLVSNVSHELRAPLASIKAYTELLLDEAERANNTTCRDWLAVINRETDRLTSLITDYLNLARLEAGHFQLADEPLSFAAVIAEVVGVLGVQAEQRHIQVHMEMQPTLPELWADRELIRLAVRNLISNAIKFSADGGHIYVDLWHEDGAFKFVVQDEGSGIPEEALAHLFDRFFRARGSDDVPGTGLGLALAKEAVTAHGGHIAAESTLGKGSRFTVTIPARRRTVLQQDELEHA